ncbi:MAG: class I SAM-dependent methyltransferase [Pseudomonadales bacterium]|nr:class I SAM-dependent methyltransferase [Pseudomonadales bacterium]
MHWKTKAQLQNLVSLLPPVFSERVYYLLQTLAGRVRFNANSRITSLQTAHSLLEQNGYTVRGKKLIEIGTGTIPIVPICYHLLGARSVLTVDLNEQLRPSLTIKFLEWLNQHKQHLPFDQSRLKNFMDNVRKFPLTEALREAEIQYLPGSDARNLPFKDDSFDIAVSNRVMEHIEPRTVVAITNELDRLTTEVQLHRIDYSDHFSHSDKSISRINFLQYSDNQWRKYGSNRYSYVNRLRHDDFTHMYSNEGFSFIDYPEVDESCDRLLKEGFSVARQFDGKGRNVLATTGAWFLLLKR